MQSHSNTESSVLQYQAGEWGPDNGYNRKVLTTNEIDSKHKPLPLQSPGYSYKMKTQVSLMEFHKQAKQKRVRAKEREIEETQLCPCQLSHGIHYISLI